MSGWPVDQMTGEESSTREPSMTSTHRGKLELWIGKDDKLCTVINIQCKFGTEFKGSIFQRFIQYIAMGKTIFHALLFSFSLLEKCWRNCQRLRDSLLL